MGAVEKSQGEKSEYQEVVYQYRGDTLQFEERFEADNPGPPLHIHPAQSEIFRVLEGSLTVVLSDSVVKLKAGESHEILAGVPHTFNTLGSVGALAVIEITPAAQMEMFFRGIGRAEQEGLHPLLQIAVMYAASADFAFYFAGPPLWAQKLLFTVLAPIARIKGYRAEL